MVAFATSAALENISYEFTGLETAHFPVDGTGACLLRGSSIILDNLLWNNSAQLPVFQEKLPERINNTPSPHVHTDDGPSRAPYFVE